MTQDQLDAPSRTPAEIERLTSEAISRADQRVDAAVRIESPTFDELFGALDDAAREVLVAFGQGGFLRSVAADPLVREAADVASEQIEKWRSALAARDDLASAIDRFAAAADPDALDEDSAGFVRRWQTEVRLAGAGLPPAARAEVRAINNRLIELQTAFLANLIQIETLTLTSAELEGVPEPVMATLKPGSQAGTFEAPMNEAVAPAILERARHREVRERTDRARLNRGAPGNLAILEEVVTSRRRMARLLGYRSWLELRIENLAAPDVATIEGFVDDMAERLEPIARTELEAMRRMLRAEPGESSDVVLQDWDWRFLEAEQRASLGARPDELAAYLELEAVVRGLAALSESVFGVRLIEHPERTGWHPDVRAFDLEDRDTGTLIARLFFDPYVREGKAGNPFMDTLDPGSPGPAGSERPPTLALIASAPEPTDGPSLIGLTDVDVLFHEYGHVLDFALEPSRFAIYRPEVWVPMDWIEGPSGFLGRWGTNPEVMATFARHHVTGAPIPTELLEPLVRLESVNTAMRMLRWLSIARLDLLIHGEAEITLEEALRTSWPIRGTPFPEGTAEPASFPHLLTGYDCAIYGWVWSSVLSDDLQSRFEREGMTSPAVGMAYRRALLETPWTKDPLDGHAAFMGRPWSTDAFIERVERGVSSQDAAGARDGPG